MIPTKTHIKQEPSREMKRMEQLFFNFLYEFQTTNPETDKLEYYYRVQASYMKPN